MFSKVCLISNDFIVVDSGSADDTIEIEAKRGAKVISIVWNGYGNARNNGAKNCSFDWILSIDADERLSEPLIQSLKTAHDLDPTIVYGFTRQSYFLTKKICYGVWAFDKIYRLYNRTHISWNLSPVHECLFGADMKKKIIPGYADHYTIKQIAQNTWKIYNYASLCARKYFDENRKASFVKMYVSPLFNFPQSYLLYIEFLDGKEGLIIAKSIAKYTYLKYFYLHEMRKLHSSAGIFLVK